jgi:uncharacterized membrane protein YciS (DUF1049 family)
MRVLFVILVLSVGAILVAVAAMWLRLRWHLRRSDQALKNALADIQREQEPSDKV